MRFSALSAVEPALVASQAIKTRSAQNRRMFFLAE